MYSDRGSKNLQELVRDLDAKLARTGGDPRATPASGAADTPASKGPRRRRVDRFVSSVPLWTVYLALTAVVVSGAWIVLRPLSPPCEYSADICAVQRLDIDALRITIPDSDLIAQLPDINEIDPEDRMTAGDVFALDRFEDLDLAELLTPEEVELLLGTLEG